MNTPLNARRSDIDRLARRRVRARMSWYTHAGIYLAVLTGLSLLATWNGRHLPSGLALGWGLGLAIHGARVWLGVSGLSERLVEAERQRIAASQGPSLD